MINCAICPPATSGAQLVSWQRLPARIPVGYLMTTLKALRTLLMQSNA
jgi:hypothetical protein